MQYCALLAFCLLPAWTWAQSTEPSRRDCGPVGSTVTTVDSSRSGIEILVRKAGFLKRFGHDHVVLARNLEGHVNWLPDLLQACGVVSFQATSLVVDDPLYREKYQLSTNPSSNDIEKTRANMLSKVLDSSLWPDVTIQLRYDGGALPALKVRAGIKLHGAKRDFVVPVTASFEDSIWHISGDMEILQSDFGIKPFSAAGGALRIEDKLQIRFTIYLN